jgi:hypothetical protein
MIELFYCTGNSESVVQLVNRTKGASRKNKEEPFEKAIYLSIFYCFR